MLWLDNMENGALYSKVAPVHPANIDRWPEIPKVPALVHTSTCEVCQVAQEPSIPCASLLTTTPAAPHCGSSPPYIISDTRCRGLWKLPHYCPPLRTPKHPVRTICAGALMPETWQLSRQALQDNFKKGSEGASYSYQHGDLRVLSITGRQGVYLLFHIGSVRVPHLSRHTRFMDTCKRVKGMTLSIHRY